MSDQRTHARGTLSDAQRTALRWILAEAVETSNARRPDLIKGDAAQEWMDLREAISLLPDPERSELLAQLSTR